MATRNIVPRTTEEGQIGTTAKKWLKGYFKDLYMGSTPAKCSVEGHTHSAATTSAAGFVELATDAETQAGTDTTRSVTPASLKSAVPFKTTASRNLYVNSGAAYGSYGAGSDSNAGTQAAPFATIGAAMAALPDFLAGLSASIWLAGTPNYYEWLPNGTSGLSFSSHESGVTISVQNGSSLSVAVSGKAVTVTLATGGNSGPSIALAIRAHAEAGSLIHCAPIGDSSTISATISAQALTGGNVRTYDESIPPRVFCGGRLSVGNQSATNYRGIILAPSTANAVPASIPTGLDCFTLQGFTIYTGATSSAIAVKPSELNVGSSPAVGSSIHVIGPFLGGFLALTETMFLTSCYVYGARDAAFCASNGAVMSVSSAYGAGNVIGLKTLSGIIVKRSTSALYAGTTESASPAGTIIGG